MDHLPALHPMITSVNGPFVGSPSFLIPLTTPFYYNPSAGNLLMDVRVTSGYQGFSSAITYDGFSISGDPVSSVTGFTLSSTTGIADTMGLVTAFSLSAVPEPSTT